MPREIEFYYVIFWDKNDPPIQLSAQGGAELQRDLNKPDCPQFVYVKDDVVNKNAIEKVKASYKNIPTKLPYVPEQTPEQRADSMKRMEDIKSNLSQKFDWFRK